MDNHRIKVRTPDLTNSGFKFGGYRDLTPEEKEAISMQPRTELTVTVTPAQKIEAMKLVIEMEKVRPKMIPYIKVDDLWE